MDAQMDGKTVIEVLVRILNAYLLLPQTPTSQKCVCALYAAAAAMQIPPINPYAIDPRQLN